MAKALKRNVLYYGDNLEVLRDYVPTESVDLIYLDPPFNSNRSYNVLFKEPSAKGESPAQIQAFEDTWHPGESANRAFEDVALRGGDNTARLLQAMVSALGHNDVTAYLSMMAVRLIELHRVLKPTGSIYLHCDPTASHYLKVLMDSIFGPMCFRNEIVWRRTGSHNKVRRYGPIHDTILFYTRTSTSDFVWQYPKRPYMQGHVDDNFVRDDKGYRTNYYGNVLTGSGLRGGESGQPWKGFDPSKKNRHWAIPGALVEDMDDDFAALSQHEKLDKLLELGHITITPGQAWPMYQRYLKPTDGQALSDVWAYQPYTDGLLFEAEGGIDEDVRWLTTRAPERLGYQTQKPLGLLERIIEASSNPGDVVLDPFCGCGHRFPVAHRIWAICVICGSESMHR